VQQAQTEEELAAAAEIFAQMDKESAAEAIANMTEVTDMVKILTHMPSEQAAVSMEEMDSDVVTEILSEMMK
jgi:Mg/Co/Ni transporter MgtE